jgi:hypothetical protein
LPPIAQDGLVIKGEQVAKAKSEPPIDLKKVIQKSKNNSDRKIVNQELPEFANIVVNKPLSKIPGVVNVKEEAER